MATDWLPCLPSETRAMCEEIYVQAPSDLALFELTRHAHVSQLACQVLERLFCLPGGGGVQGLLTIHSGFEKDPGWSRPECSFN